MKKKSIKINNKELILQVGKFAFQTKGSVLAQMGETIVLATVVSSSPREDIDYFPLYVEYQEKLYAGGIIKGSRWVKREGRPSDEAILTARLIDRSIRPLFPKGYKNEVQVIITVLSIDGENDPDILAICAASAALAISDIPWNGPIGAARIAEPKFPDLNLVISGTKKSIVMIEANANEVPEKKLASAFKYGSEIIKKVVKLIEDLQKEIGQKKQAFEKKEIKPELIKEVKKKAEKRILDLIKQKEGKVSLSSLDEIKNALFEELEEESKKDINLIVDECFKNLAREQILKKKIRIDGRKNNEIRPLKIETDILPRTHGSAIFQRGLTQALTITTLGSPSLEQLIESMEGEETKRYIHHYYMPPFSVGETGRVGWPSRREVGHGALAERALEPVIPPEEKFPYTIRVVSEIMSCNGSSSMASVCGSSLSLMDAGVPIKKPVAGIAMGLIMSKVNDHVILTDILGIEDHLGDMDFKVAGTKDGITALQMDVKTLKITLEILIEGLNQAKKARNHILDEMGKIISSPRPSVSKYAPKITVIKIDKEKIGDIIGPGGRIIRQIINETGVAMDVDDDGKVTISSLEKDGIEKAVEWVKNLTREVQIGEEFLGEVKRIQPFGAFVEILPGKDGLVHVSRMSSSYVKDPNEIVKVGQKVKVKVEKIDDMGKVGLTMLFGEEARKAQENRRSYQNRENQRRPGNKRNSRYSRNSKYQRGPEKKKEFTSLYFKKKF